METQRMIKVSVEVRSEAARFPVSVQAESIQRALSLVAGRFPASNCRVKFPIEAEGFFVKDSSALAGMGGTEQTHQEAA
jgi:hypothetical protein